jgi:hypothetical protein
MAMTPDSKARRTRTSSPPVVNGMSASQYTSTPEALTADATDTGVDRVRHVTQANISAPIETHHPAPNEKRSTETARSTHGKLTTTILA